MKKPAQSTADFMADTLATVIGWAVCMVMASGFYWLGYGAATYLGGSQHRDAFGILSAIVLIWLYEHRRAEERWGRLLDISARASR